MLKKLAAIVLTTSFVFAPVIATAQAGLTYYRQHAKAQLEKANLKVVGGQTSSANAVKAASIEAAALGPGTGQFNTINRLEQAYVRPPR